MTMQDAWLEEIDREVRGSYAEQNRLLSFDEYLALVRKNPGQQIRASAQYVKDMFDYFGREGEHFKLFDQEFVDSRFKLIGHEPVQQRIYQILQSFIREGLNNKLILLHGPNGSAKTSLIACMVRGLEEYSTKPEGALYRFHWVFPVDRYGKPGLGLSGDNKNFDKVESFARLNDDEIAARIPCDLKDNPLFLIPSEERLRFIKDLDTKGLNISEYIAKGELSQKSKMIFEALLRSYKGDYRKVLRHIQVERFYISRRYRQSAVAIEPQLHVDADVNQVTMDQSLRMIPSTLHSLNLFVLAGDLIDGNRGLVEYNDLLKRPIDAFKYLLVTCETGSANIKGIMALLDAVLIGTCNELQLDGFKEYPDFTSFKARIELVRVPYLLSHTKEKEIYKTQIKRVAGEAHVAPHTLRLAALWAVLTRLKKPNASHYPSSMAYLINSLSPLEKAMLLDTGQPPLRLTAEEKKLLRANLEEIQKEYNSVPYYEGRSGASPREIKLILFDALERNERKILSPLGLFSALNDFVKRDSEYEFLRENIVDGFHDCKGFIQILRDVYLSDVDDEVRSCLGMHDDKQYEGFLRKYIVNVTHVLKKEKIKNPVTGTSESPDMYLIDEFEKIVKATGDKQVYRQNLISTVGAYVLDNPQVEAKEVNYAKVFPDLIQKIRDHYINEHRSILRKIYDALVAYGELDGGRKTSEKGTHSMEQQESIALGRRLLENMIKRYEYNDISAKEAFSYLVQKRY